MKRIVNIIEEDPHLNFIALLKSYKVLGKFLNGTLHEFYRDRNKLYFKNFFYDKRLYKLVKSDLEALYPDYKDVRMTLTKRGVVIYDNFKKNSFNILLLTIHSGTWVPHNIEKKLSIPHKSRITEEDVDTHKIYNKLVLEKGGIWIDNKQSRFVIDLNRSLEKAIYADNSEDWLNKVWSEKLTKAEIEDIYSSYTDFYFMLSKLVQSYNFNIVFDAHSMKDLAGRPNISFGTEYIPKFYMPIVKSMQKKMIELGYKPVLLNTPYHGGYILKWLSEKFSNVFICSMEINKNLYMTKDRSKSISRKVEKLSRDLTNIFDMAVE
ncbi:N-formylglutamate amidohydrolase [Nanoarchaeota archaeon]